MISERSYERPWWRGGKVRLNYNGGGSWEHGKFQQLPKTLPSNAFLRGARGGWKGRLVLQTGRRGRRPRLVSKWWNTLWVSLVLLRLTTMRRRVPSNFEICSPGKFQPPTARLEEGCYHQAHPWSRCPQELPAHVYFWVTWITRSRCPQKLPVFGLLKAQISWS